MIYPSQTLYVLLTYRNEYQSRYSLHPMPEAKETNYSNSFQSLCSEGQFIS